MQARGPLMMEHRLMEKMLAVIQRALERASQAQAIDPKFVDTVVDFFEDYVDRLHHGKEEAILFNTLRSKGLSSEDERLMNELVEEHVFARQMVDGLGKANVRYRQGAGAGLSEVTAPLETVVDFYPRHIIKEDKSFFPAAQGYLSPAEDQAMIAKFWEFDRQMIHEKYKAVIKSLEGA